MRGTTKVMLSLGAILLWFGMMACQEGPGKSGKKYAGTYVYKGETLVDTLEIKPDGTFKLTGVSPRLQFLEPSVLTGTWEISGEGKEEEIVFYPFSPRLAFLVKKGNNLFCTFTGETFVKQAAAVQKTQKETKDKPKVAKTPKPPKSPKTLIPQKDILATYTSGDSFLELRRRDKCFIGIFGKWKINTRRLSYPYEDEVEYKIVLITGRESDSGYLEGDTITGLELQDLDLVKHEGAKPVKRGYGKLWSTYVDPEEGLLVEFKEDGTLVMGYFGKWKRKGDTIRLYLEGEEKPAELKIKGKTIRLPDGDVLVKQK